MVSTMQCDFRRSITFNMLLTHFDELMISGNDWDHNGLDVIGNHARGTSFQKDNVFRRIGDTVTGQKLDVLGDQPLPHHSQRNRLCLNERSVRRTTHLSNRSVQNWLSGSWKIQPPPECQEPRSSCSDLTRMSKLRLRWRRSMRHRYRDVSSIGSVNLAPPNIIFGGFWCDGRVV